MKPFPLFLLALLICLLALCPASGRAQAPQLVTQIGHTNGVLTIAFSPDGRVLASGSRDSAVKLWDVESGLLLRTLQGHALSVTALAFSPDGGRLASGGADADIRLWDVATGRLVQTLPRHRDPLWEQTFGENAVTRLAFIHDEAALAAGAGLIGQYDDRAVEVYGLAPASHLMTFIPPETAAELAQSPVGDMMGIRDAKDFETSRKSFPSAPPRPAGPSDANTRNHSSIQAVRRMLRRYSARPAITSIFSPDGKYLILCQKGDHSELMNLAADQPGPPLTGAVAAVGAPFAFAPQRSLALVKIAGIRSWPTSRTPSKYQLTHIKEVPGQLRLFSLTTGRSAPAQIHEPTTFSEQVTRASRDEDSVVAAFSADGSALAVSGGATGDKTVRLWDTATGELTHTLLGPSDSTNGITFSPDGHLVAAASDDKTVTLWDAATGTRLRVFDGLAQPIQSVAFSPDGTRLASGGSELNAVQIVGGEEAEDAHIWSLTESRPLQTLTGLKGSILTLAFSDNGRALAGGSVSNRLQVWDGETGAPQRALKGTHALAFQSGGRTLMSDLVSTQGETSKAVRWNMASGEAIKTFRLDTGIDGDLVAFSPDGARAACGNSAGGISLFDAVTGTKQRHIAVFPTYDTRDDADAYLSALTFSPDSRTLASDGPGATVKLWDSATGRLLRTLTGHRSTVTCLAFSPDGRTLAGGSRDATILLWDIATGRPVCELAGHDGPVRGMSFRADGKMLASGSDDATTRLWDITTGQEKCRLISFPHGDWVVATPDGRFDTDDLDNAQSLHWVLPDAPFTPLPLEAFMRQYYEPRLLARLLSGEKLPDIPSIATLNRVQPQVHITDIKAHTDDPAVVDVTVGATGDTGTFQQNGQEVVKQSGVYDLRLFRNGQLVGYLPQGDEGGRPTDLTNGTNGSVSHTFTVHLVPDGSKSVEFSAYAFNADQVKSQTERRTYTLPQPLPVAKGRAYVLSLGVNAYEDPHWDLQFAANDARRLQSTLLPDLQKTGQFSQVVSIPLVSDHSVVNGQVNVTVGGATKAAFHAVLDLLAGRPVDPALQRAIPNAALIQKARPEDLVLITFSCHGAADAHGGDFYVFPYDIGPQQGGGLTDDLKRHAISSRELSLWLRDVDAGAMAMVVDACHSAASVDAGGFKPGPMGSRGLGQLAYDKGLQILTASQADSVALESDKLQQGLLTYALVEDGLEAGQADAEPKDGTITLTKWLRYGVARVPPLYGEVQKGQVQAFGRDMPRAVELVDTGGDKAAAPPLQQPSLFDFNKQKREVMITAAKK